MSTATEERKVALNIREVPKDLRDEFKAWCVRNGTTMVDEIEAFMRRMVRTSPAQKV